MQEEPASKWVGGRSRRAWDDGFEATCLLPRKGIIECEGLGFVSFKTTRKTACCWAPTVVLRAWAVLCPALATLAGRSHVDRVVYKSSRESTCTMQLGLRIVLGVVDCRRVHQWQLLGAREEMQVSYWCSDQTERMAAWSEMARVVTINAEKATEGSSSRASTTECPVWEPGPARSFESLWVKTGRRGNVGDAVVEKANGLTNKCVYMTRNIRGNRCVVASHRSCAGAGPA